MHKQKSTISIVVDMTRLCIRCRMVNSEQDTYIMIATAITTYHNNMVMEMLYGSVNNDNFCEKHNSIIVAPVQHAILPSMMANTGCGRSRGLYHDVKQQISLIPIPRRDTFTQVNGHCSDEGRVQYRYSGECHQPNRPFMQHRF